MNKRWGTLLLFLTLSALCASFIISCGPLDSRLAKAAKENELGLLKLYVRLGGNVNKRSRFGDFTLLHYAASYGSLEASNFLLSHGASVDIRSIKGKETQIDWACRWLLEPTVAHKEKPSITRRKSVLAICQRMQQHASASPLTAAIASGDLSLVESLIQGGADVNKVDEHGFLPLTTAAFHGNIDMCTLLLANGAGKWLTEQSTGASAPARTLLPIRVAAMQEGPEVTAFLLAEGADPNGYGLSITPIMIAVLFGELETIDLLLKSGADPNIFRQGLERNIRESGASQELKIKMENLIREKMVNPPPTSEVNPIVL